MYFRLAAMLLTVTALAGCTDTPGDRRSGLRVLGGPDRPDEYPVMVNSELPFRYPAALYTRKVQGNVTLRLYIDRDGRVLPESTKVEESSGFGSLDSAAVKGSQELYFIPAKLHGEPLGVAVFFPVYFRHPEASPLPGDTILGMRESGIANRAIPSDSASRIPRPTPR